MNSSQPGPFGTKMFPTLKSSLKIRHGRVSGVVACILLVGTSVPADASAIQSLPVKASAIFEAPLRVAIESLVVAREDNEGYDRMRYFGVWADTDGDCQSTRHEVLIRESKAPISYKSLGCKVVKGRWKSSWNNSVLTLASSIEVDHTVPVHEAWGSGAKFWSQSRRVAFYNDLGDSRSLSPQPIVLNWEKGGQSPQNWVPPENRCAYIANWVAVKIRWGLTVNLGEKKALVDHASSCPNVNIRVKRV